jgi:hypothetical protein
LGSLGIKEISADLNVNIYPNPLRNSTNMVFTLNKAERVGVKIISMVGSTVYSQNVKYYPAGENRIQIDGENFRNDLYFIELSIGDQKYTQKVSVIK